MPFSQLSFNLPGKVFASQMPFSLRDDRAERVMQDYLENEVKVVVMLVSDQEARDITGRDLRALYKQAGMQVIHLPIPDYEIPEPNALREAVDQALTQVQNGRNVAIHCHAGIGRTGMFAACLARKALGLGGQEAIDWVRAQRVNGAVEGDAQEQVVRDFC